ncbi:MAG: phosphomannomutase/phosphoglucomutase [Lachnospiraceae bacterium]|nr:phosphomannomutase/phosphoglucomutase [Lachnospiraceae bacterium]
MEYRDLFLRVKNGNDVRGAALAAGDEKRTLAPGIVSFIAAAYADFLAARYGKAVGAIRVGVGHDSRITAPEMKAAAIRGLAAAQVYDCGLITTPAMFQSTVLPESSFDGAIMLTASHLPFNRNGMKFFTRDGALEGKELAEILEAAAVLAEKNGRLDEEELLIAEKLPEAEHVTVFDMKAAYAAHMKEIICREVQADDYEHPLKGLHITVDAGNGASGFFTTDILEPLGADTTGSVFLEPDGSFPNHVPNPENAEAMAAARQATISAGADLGVIFDCDGDRAAVVFSDGTEVNRNALIALLAVIVAEKHPGSTVVTDSVTSDELAVFLTEEAGLKHLRFKRGYKNVINKGIELNAAGEECELAIETSGHGAFRENYFSDDGAYISVRIICKMAQLRKEGKRIESLIEGLKTPAEAAEIRMKIQTDNFREAGLQVLDEFRTFAEKREDFHIVEPNYEGIRVSFDDPEVKGWMLLRLSLHDPVMPMNVESSDKGGVEVILGRIHPFFAERTVLKPDRDF